VDYVASRAGRDGGVGGGGGGHGEVGGGHGRMGSTTDTESTEYAYTYTEDLEQDWSLRLRQLFARGLGRPPPVAAPREMRAPGSGRA